MIKIKFLGALSEVGASAILLKIRNKKFVLDYGIKQTEKEPIFPPIINYFDAIFLSHSHLDHCGALPILIKNRNVPIFSLEINKYLTNLLLIDTLKIAKEENYSLPFSKKDIKQTEKCFAAINYRETLIFEDIEIKFFDAGHIPGSAMIFLKYDKNSILYTGDFNYNDTRLVKGCDKEIPKPKILIIESTYSYKDHPDREKEEKRFCEEIKKVLENNGIVLISAFAISRAQEIMLILKEHLNKKFYLDGLAKQVSKLFLKYSNLLKDKKKYRKALKKAKFVKSKKERKKIVNESCIILTPSGMLNGGPVVDYIKMLYKDENSALFLTGFQAPETPGRKLLEQGKFIYKDIELDVKMRVLSFDFSAHAGKTELFKFIEELEPEIIFCVHGDYTIEFAEELKSKGFNAIAPTKENNLFKF